MLSEQSPCYGIDPDCLYTRREAANLLRISVSTMDKERAEHRGIRYIKRGQKVLYLGADIVSELDRCFVNVA